MMPRPRHVPAKEPPRGGAGTSGLIEPDLETAKVGWPVLRVRVPPDWKEWLEDAARHRALSVSALVRQCIRELMIARHK
jgi:hypothetical protein